MRLYRRRDVLLVGVCLGLIGFGVALRAWQIAHPPVLTFDENHFVENARNYLSGRADWNDHPPLGKLFIAEGIRLWGDNSLGWRVCALVAGWVNIALAAALGQTAFESPRAALLSAAFVAGDGFFITYSRTALLDGVLTMFFLATALATLRARRSWHVALAALTLGLGCSMKFSAVTLLAPLVLVTLILGRAPRWSAIFLLLAPAVYTAIYSYGLALTHQPSGVADVVRATEKLYRHHAGLTQGTHPLISRWYEWFLPTKPITLRIEERGPLVRVMVTLGNPLLWWAASLALAGSVIAFGAALLQMAKARSKGLAERLRMLDRAEFWLALFWFLPVLPWMLYRRDSYIYHYLPAYGFAVVLVAGALARLLEARPRAAWAGIGLIVLASLWVSPVWVEAPVSHTGYALRVWFPGWRLPLRN
jgi:dolichyl-phosphate-mannose-protein mannosyltransferase